MGSNVLQFVAAFCHPLAGLHDVYRPDAVSMLLIKANIYINFAKDIMMRDEYS